MPPLDHFYVATACRRSTPKLALYPSHASNLHAAARPTDVLVLSRKVGERILIGDKIAITVVKIGHGGVRIGVEAPTELAIVREELANELERTERALAAGDPETMID